MKRRGEREVKEREGGEEVRLYRMRDLVRETGVPRETIHFYLSEGLLPPPVRKSRNMAWYREEHVDRIRKIKELQEKHFLPLKAIKAIVSDGGGMTFTPAQERVIASLKRRYAEKRVERSEKMLSIGDFSRRFGIPEEEVEELERLGVLTLDRSGEVPRIVEEDAGIAEIVGRLSKIIGLSGEEGEGRLGLRLADLELYVQSAMLLFAEELEILRERMAEIKEEEALLLFETVMPLLNDLLALLHKKQVRRFLARFAANSDPRGGEDEGPDVVRKTPRAVAAARQLGLRGGGGRDTDPQPEGLPPDDPLGHAGLSRAGGEREGTGHPEE